MAFLRNLFRRTSEARPTPPPATEPPVAFYLDGNGRMTAIKQSGFSASTSTGRTGLGYIIANAEQYARAAIASVWAANCISRRSQAISRLDWHVRHSVTKEVIDNHPLTVALGQSKQNIPRLLEKNLLVYGEFFLKPLHNDYGYASACYVLNNLDVAVDTAYGYLSGFLYIPQGASQQHYFYPMGVNERMKQIGYIHTDNPYDDFRGLSKFEHCLLEIGIDNNISRTTAAFYRNDARPGLLLIPEMDLTPTQRDEFVDYWNSQFKGPDKAGRTVLVPKSLKEIKEFQRAPSIDDVELRESTRREICAAFEVPLSIAGAWDDATYQSLPEQRKSFYEETIIPAAEGHARDLTKHILPFFDDDPDHEVYFDAETVLALIENTQEKVAINTQKLQAGAYTVNEYRKANGDDPIEGGDIHLMQSGWIPVHSSELATFEAPNSAAPPETELPQLPAPQEGAALPAQASRSAKQVISQEGYASLSFADNAQLINIQRILKDLLPDSGIEWQIPATFHITLVYAPDVSSNALLDVVNNLTFDEFMVSSHAFGIFENGDERALHLVIDPDPALLKLQEELWLRFENAGLVTSEYSEPEQYTPHITIAYLPKGVNIPDGAVADFNDRVDSLVFSKGDYETFAVVRGTVYKSHDHHHHDQPIETFAPIDTIEIKTVHAAALAELAAWQKYLKNGTAQKRDFQIYMIREDIADAIKAAIATGDDPTIEAAFTEAETLAAIKAADVIRSNWELEIKTLIDGGRGGSIARRDFTNRLRATIRSYGNDAFRAGLTDGGVITNKGEGLPVDDQATVNLLINDQLQHAKGLAEQLYTGNLTDAQARLKPRQWWGKTMLPFYDAGLLSANRNGMIEIVGPIDKNSCDSCRALVGQRHRRRIIAAAGLMPPYGANIICGDGGLCKHRAISVNSRARGSLSRVPKR